jgi:hypothetical protein
MYREHTENTELLGLIEETRRRVQVLESLLQREGASDEAQQQIASIADMLDGINDMAR